MYKLTGKEAREMTPTTVDLICKDVALVAEKGDEYLNLFNINYGFEYSRMTYKKRYKYTEKDLQELKDLGYRVEVTHIETEKEYRGMLWWKKEISSITKQFYTIYW